MTATSSIIALHQKVRIMLFFFSLFIIFILSISSWNQSVSTSENRKLSSFPSLAEKTSWKQFFKGVDKFTSDHFAFRQQIIKYYSYAKLKWLGKPITNKVVMGKENWLFHNRDYVKRDFIGSIPFNKLQLRTWQTLLQKRVNLLNDSNIKYYVVIAPDKHEIYSSLLPKSFGKKAPINRLTQFMAMATRHQLPVLNLKSIMLSKKGTEIIWHRHDTHWTHLGAFYGYQALWNKFIHPEFGLPPMQKEEFEFDLIPAKSKDLAYLLSLPEVFQETVPYLHLSSLSPFKKLPALQYSKKFSPLLYTSSKNLGLKAVIIRDSFGTHMIPFLISSFSRVLFLSRKDIGFNYDIIKQEQPDLVIQLFVQRTLNTVNPDKLK